MAIISSYFAGETYGLLGPQMAATLIELHTAFECIVVAVAREDDKTLLERALYDYFGPQRPVVGFSSLSGREDLFNFAGYLTKAGCHTILAGPQADVDFKGEVGRSDFPHRFEGLSRRFSCALQGPAEQSFQLLAGLDAHGPRKSPGLLYREAGGAIVQIARQPWEEQYLGIVRWDNIFRLSGSRLIAHPIGSAQVLQGIGCPHAAVQRNIKIDYPAFLRNRQRAPVGLSLRGCSFCDIAADKGFRGTVAGDTVLKQIDYLPADPDGRKIPFELINENPLAGLLSLLDGAAGKRILLSRINLAMRADWFLKGLHFLRPALRRARDLTIRVVLTSVGLESFDDTILRNLNKGLGLDTIIQAVAWMRRLKEEFPDVWGYTRADGANHGFIHPTPWDTDLTARNIQTIIDRYRLAADILPDHSTPLIIHHASGLADWIRIVERQTGVRFRRCGSIIAWWQA